jgi:uncharacterized membrane protein YeaQ/YmgE (transglycosylase-associated protein family)
MREPGQTNMAALRREYRLAFAGPSRDNRRARRPIYPSSAQARHPCLGRDEIMGIISWIILGLVAGFIGSKIVNKRGEGIIIDIVLGVVGAVVGGYLVLCSASSARSSAAISSA